ncbi:hypothetical protein C0993_009584 [Termitomyces sp. T159_Od127]|nr:hypothetical protein C0993_009584 [Termitomyces sp. T159_Od127]
MHQALTASQTVLTDQHTGILHLEDEINALREQHSNSTNSAGNYIQWLTNPRLVPHKFKIIHLLKKYALLYELWPDEAAFLQCCPANHPSFKEASVSMSVEEEAVLYILCATDELYEVMPFEFHSFIEQLLAFRDAVSFLYTLLHLMDLIFRLLSGAHSSSIFSLNFSFKYLQICR